MNIDTLDKMRQMRLFGMFRAFKTSLETQCSTTLTTDEMVAMLVDSHWDDHYNPNIERAIHNARFRYKAIIEALDYSVERGLDKNQVHRLADGEFIRKKEDLLITGSVGTGKSYLASALGHQCCQLGYRVLYANATRLFAQLKIAKADASAIKELMKIEKQDLFVLDDFGIQPLDAGSRAALLNIIEDRHGKASLIITSQLPVSKWYEVIGEKTIADAILDRIIHDAHRLKLKGESLRKKKRQTAQN